MSVGEPEPRPDPDGSGQPDAWAADYDEALRRGRTPPDPPPGRDRPADDARAGRIREAIHLLHAAFPTHPPNRDDVPPPVAGSIVGSRVGRFVIEEELGRGGFGVVVRAFDPEMGRRVALKLPRADALGSPPVRRRLLREARSAARLDHPNLVPVYEAGEAGPLCYIASAYCQGPTLRQWLDARGEPLDARSAATLTRTMAGAIGHMHARGIIHCDLKPGNVMLDASEPPPVVPIPRITDFGLSRLLEAGPSDNTAARPLGTPPYAPPEQVEQRVEDISPATDVHALGAILYELLVGRPTHAGTSSWAMMRAVVTDPPVPPRRLRRSIPADLEAICLRCLEKRPSARYPDAAALADDLDRFLDGRPTVARPLGPFRRIGRWSRRHPTAAAMACMGLLMLVISLAHSAALTRTVTKLDEAKNRLESALADSRRQHYAMTLVLAQEEARDGRVAQAQNRLRTLIPQDGEPDPRDFAWHYLYRQLRRDFTVLASLPREPMVVAAASDGTLMVAGRQVLGFWRYHRSVESDRPIVRTLGGLPIDSQSVFGVGAIDPSGRRAVVGNMERDRETWLVDLSEGAKRLLETRPIQAAAFSGDGRVLVLSGDRAGPRPSERISGEEDLRLMVVGDARKLAIADANRTVVAIHEVKPTNTGGGCLQAYEIATGRLLYRRTGEGIGEALAASPVDGGLFATATGNTIHLREPSSGEVVATIDGHGGEVQALAFSADGTRLVSGDATGCVSLWDVPARRRLTVLDNLGGRVQSAAIIPGGSDTLLGISDGLVLIWHPEPIAQPPPMVRHAGEVWDAAYSPDGRLLASGGDDHIVRLSDAATGRPIRLLRGHGSLVTSLAFSPDGRTLASGDHAGAIRFWDVATGRPIRTLRAHTLSIRDLAFLRDATLVSTGRDGVVALWDVATGGRVATPIEGRKDLRALAVDPSGRTLVAGGNDEEVLIWDAEVGTLRDRWPMSHDVTALAISPDGHTLAVATKLGFVSLHDLRSGAQCAGLPLLHTDEIRGLAFSPDGRVLACAGLDGIATLVDVETGRRHLTLTGHEAGVHAVAFSPDGRTLASAGFDGSVLFWWAGPENVPKQSR